MAILFGFQDFFYSFNEKNKARGNQAKTETKKRFFPRRLEQRVISSFLAIH